MFPSLLWNSPSKPSDLWPQNCAVTVASYVMFLLCCIYYTYFVTLEATEKKIFNLQNSYWMCSLVQLKIGSISDTNCGCSLISMSVIMNSSSMELWIMCGTRVWNYKLNKCCLKLPSESASLGQPNDTKKEYQFKLMRHTNVLWPKITYFSWHLKVSFLNNVNNNLAFKYG